MNTNSKQSTDKPHSAAVCRIIGVLFVLFAFIWLPTPEVDASLELKAPLDCERTVPETCPPTDKVTVFRWTQLDNPQVFSYGVIFGKTRDFSNDERILELSEFDNEKIFAPQVALDLDNGIFDAGISYYWRAVALDESGIEVEESQETFAFFYIEDSSGYTVITGLVKSDLNQLGLVGARVAVSSARHAETTDVTNKIAVSEFNGQYYVVALTTDSNGNSIDFPIKITSIKKGFQKRVVDNLTENEKVNGVITRNLVMIADFDGDGIKDRVENASPCLDDEDADTDDDGIADGDEDTNKNGVINSGETDPCRLDTDNDGIQDGTELGLMLDDIGSDTDTAIFQPDLDPTTTTNPLDDDTDNDGLLDGEEDKNHNGRVDAGETDPSLSSNRALPHNLLLLLED